MAKAIAGFIWLRLVIINLMMTSIFRNPSDLNFRAGQWTGMLYQLAPVIYSCKPAIAVNRARMDPGDPLWPPETESFVRFNPDYTTRIFKLRSMDQHVLVLFYKPDRLAEVLSKPDNRKLLAGLGYGPDVNLEDDLNHLQSRLHVQFPHEIGVFLGIPAHDVTGFIVNKGKNYLFNGYWKVYQEPDQARRVFDEFNRAKRIMSGFISDRYNLQKI